MLVRALVSITITLLLFGRSVLMDTTRECKRCRSVKEAGEFCRSSATKDGFCAYCKECMRQIFIRSAYGPDGKRNCSKCKRSGLEPNNENFYNDRSTADGLSRWCKPCRNQASKSISRKEYWDRWGRNKRYGLRRGQYEAMVAEQGGRCAICLVFPSGDTKSDTLHVDHCHRTGRLRGLLCGSCNRAVGLFGDSERVLEAAIRYLEQRGGGGSGRN